MCNNVTSQNNLNSAEKQKNKMPLNSWTSCQAELLKTNSITCAMIMLFFADWLFFILLVYNSFNFPNYSKPTVYLDCIKEYSLTVFISRTFYNCGRVNKKNSFPCLSCREPKFIACIAHDHDTYHLYFTLFFFIIVFDNVSQFFCSYYSW